MYPPGYGNQPAYGAFAPLATGTPFRPYTGFEGMENMMPGGMLGQGAMMAVQPMLQQAMNQTGMFAAGMGHSQNLYDVMRNAHFTRHHQEALRQASQMDKATFVGTFRGLAHATGTPFGLEQRRAAGALSGVMAQMAPMLAQMAPEFLESISGPMGSQTVMAHNMMLGGRYRVDPVTGRMGMSANTIGQVTENIFRDMKMQSNMSGMTAGQTGQLFDEMTRRGMMGGGGKVGLRDINMGAIPLAQLQKEANAAGLGIKIPADLSKMAPADLDKLRGLDSVQTQIRAFDADRIKRSLQPYSKAVAAMRDIFGDQGRPNAPMAEIIQGLEQLSQGNLATMAPDKLATMVRQTYNLAKNTGVSLESALGLQQMAAGTARAMGLDSSFAVTAMQGGLGFRAAVAQEGVTAGWGRSNADRLAAGDTNLRVRGTQSALANQLGALMRLNDTTKGGFGEDTVAGRMVAAVKRGDTQFIDPTTGQKRDLLMRGAEFSQILQASGISAGMADRALTDTTSNDEYKAKHAQIQDINRRSMPLDFRKWMKTQLGSRMEQEAESAGLSRDQSRAVTAGLGDKLSKALSTMDEKVLADPETRRAAMAKVIEKHAAEHPEFARILAANPALASQMAESGYAGLETNRKYKYKNLGSSMQDALRLMSDKTLNNVTAGEAAARAQGRMQDAFTVFNKGGVLSNFVGALQDMKPGGSVMELVGKTFGGVDMKDIKAKMGEAAEPLWAKMEEAKKLEAAIKEEKDPDKRRELSAKHDAVASEVATMAKNMQDTAQAAGLDTRGSGLTKEQIGEAKLAGKELREMQGSLRRGGTKLDDAFWKSEKGEIFREATKNFLGSAESVVMQAFADDTIMARGGVGALKEQKAWKKNHQKLEALARKYTGGDIAKLVGGGFDAKDKDAIMQEVSNAQSGIGASVMYFDQLSSNPTKLREMSPEEKEKFDKELTAARTEDDPDQVLRRLAKVHGMDPEKFAESTSGKKALEALKDPARLKKVLEQLPGAEKAVAGGAPSAELGLGDDAGDKMKRLFANYDERPGGALSEDEKQMQLRKDLEGLDVATGKKGEGTGSGEGGEIKLSGTVKVTGDGDLDFSGATAVRNPSAGTT